MNTPSTTRATPSPLAGWITTALFAALMAVSGALYVVLPPALAVAIARLGYPSYFLRMLGVAKLLGAVGLVLPERPILREWAYAGFTFDLVAAAVSHVATGSRADALPPLFALALLAASYLLRARPFRGAR
jgi:DoxX-like protein